MVKNENKKFSESLGLCGRSNFLQYSIEDFKSLVDFIFAYGQWWQKSENVADGAVDQQAALCAGCHDVLAIRGFFEQGRGNYRPAPRSA